MGRLLFICFVLFLSGCSMMRTETVIDWADVVKIKGTQYIGIHEGVLADPASVGKMVGTVKFKMADHVNDSSYRMKNGDAAFLEKGLKLYAVKGNPKLLAVKEKSAIGGYRLYHKEENWSSYPWGYEKLKKESIRKAEVYQVESSGDPKLLRTIAAQDELSHFLSTLDQAEENSTINISDTASNYAVFRIALYTDSPIALAYHMFRGDGQYVWTPNAQELLPEEIAAYTK